MSEAILFEYKPVLALQKSETPHWEYELMKFINPKKSKILANVPKSLKKRQKNLSHEKTHEHRSENKMIRKYSNNIIIFNSCNTKKVLKQNNLKKFLSFIDQVYNKTFLSPSVFFSTYNTQSIATRLSQTVENKLFYKILISL